MLGARRTHARKLGAILLQVEHGQATGTGTRGQTKSCNLMYTQLFCHLRAGLKGFACCAIQTCTTGKTLKTSSQVVRPSFCDALHAFCVYFTSDITAKVSSSRCVCHTAKARLKAVSCGLHQSTLCQQSCHMHVLYQVGTNVHVTIRT